MSLFKEFIGAALMSMLFFIMLALCISQCNCATQASRYDGEPASCYTARYMAREKVNSDTLCKECANEIKRDWCLKVLAEKPGMFKDFNDCWRQ
ncbi:MAG: hypothetical protein WCX48_11770 [Bacteroidales bacterium]|jgi:hypothetical protein